MTRALKPRKNISWPRLAAIIGGAAMVGSIAVFAARAAGPTLAFETESGTLSGAVVTQTPTGASGGSAPKPAFNVMNYGAIGNDVADDTTKIQAAITAAAAVSGTVSVPAGTYRITNVLTVPANTTISGSGTIHQVTSGRYGLRITGNNVTIEGITLSGRHSTPTYAGSEYAIFGRGKSAVAPFAGITIRNVTISKWGAYGVYLEYVTGFSVTGANIFDIGYTGIGVLSGTNGYIGRNRIANITPGADKNMYGIILSYGGAGGATNPDTSDVVVDNNTLSTVAWEGLDSHGGKRLTFTNNTVLACRTGIMVGGSDGFTPKDIIISGNTFDRMTDNSPYGNNGSSILLWGLDSSNPATGSITGNTVRRSNWIHLKHTKNINVSGNNMQSINALGVYLSSHNQHFSIISNNFTDVWSNTQWSAAVHTGSFANTPGSIVGNKLLSSGTRTAKYFNQYGYYYRGGKVGITVTNNDFVAATAAPIAGEP